MSQVRVRFAPSPTGFFHIGSARTALFNWLYARHTGGVFVLRIEDTDQARNSAEFLQVIYDSLNWLGLGWDEGPNKGGPYGPYLQSERTAVYREYLEKLRTSGRTYEKDGAIFFKLEGERYEVFDEHRKKTVVKVRNAPAIIEDGIRGRVERMEDEDFVIFRSDGNPVFHFVNVVDDITMKITHVIRGEDHLSNTSKHIELFNAFGAPVPTYAHIPLILKQSGPGKMSKRDKGALVEEYRSRGFLPEALVNFLCLLGWNPGDDREKMQIGEIVRLFDLPGVNQSNARFDEKKLAHMNMLYVLALSEEEFAAQARDYLGRRLASLQALDSPDAAGEDAQKKAESEREKQACACALAADRSYFREVMTLSHPKIKGVEELPAYTRYFFTEGFPIDPKVGEKVMGKGDAKARLAELAEVLKTADFSSDGAIEEAIKALAAKNGLGFGDYQAVARLAVSGTNVGPSLTGMFRILGRERVMGRIDRFLGKAN